MYHYCYYCGYFDFEYEMMSHHSCVYGCDGFAAAAVVVDDGYYSEDATDNGSDYANDG